MNTASKIVIAGLAGAALGAAIMQGLHAESKLKAYSVTESELSDAAPPEFLASARKAIEAAHGRPLHGRVVTMEGPMAPEHVAIVEWDSLNDAVAFYKSKTWADMEAERKKYQKIVRRYVLDLEK
jgi:uncharacterized protein (DUF1330 family)